MAIEVKIENTNKVVFKPITIDLKINITSVKDLVALRKFTNSVLDYSGDYKEIVESNAGIRGFKFNEEQIKKLSESHKGIIPKNLNTIQKARRKKIAKYKGDEIVEIFDSCALAAESLNIKPNKFHSYIGRKRCKYKGSKYMEKDEWYDYYKG